MRLSAWLLLHSTRYEHERIDIQRGRSRKSKVRRRRSTLAGRKPGRTPRASRARQEKSVAQRVPRDAVVLAHAFFHHAASEEVLESSKEGVIESCRSRGSGRGTYVKIKSHNFKIKSNQ